MGTDEESLPNNCRNGGFITNIREHVIPLALLCIFLPLSLLTSAVPTYAQFEYVTARVKPAVVLVAVKHVLGGEGRGSGFVYDSSGFILTNHHVVEGATEITVTLADKRSFPASVVDYVRNEEYAGADFQTATDVAVLKIDASELPTLPLGDSDLLRQGQEILVFGYPGGVGTEEVSVSRGIVSALRSGWIQTDASLVPGNSGGPVVDRLGRVLGLATFVTGPSAKFIRIGGVTAINGIREVAKSALSTDAIRLRTVKVTGMEYVPRIIVGRRVRFKTTYDPGRSSGQFSVSEYTYEVTDVRNFHGALVYDLRFQNGGVTTNYLDSQGLFQIAVVDPDWKYSLSGLQMLLPLPPVVGRSWQNRWISENSRQGVRRHEVEDQRIESANEIISVPAGTFTASLKLTTNLQSDIVSNNQLRTFHGILTTWEAPGVGKVKTIEEIFETGERTVDELVGISF